MVLYVALAFGIVAAAGILLAAWSLTPALAAGRPGVRLYQSSPSGPTQALGIAFH